LAEPLEDCALGLKINNKIIIVARGVYGDTYCKTQVRFAIKGLAASWRYECVRHIQFTVLLAANLPPQIQKIFLFDFGSTDNLLFHKRQRNTEHQNRGNGKELL